MLKQKRKVVISLHGINTDGAWQKDVAPIISSQGWMYYPLHYGDFSPLKFVRSGPREEKLAWLRKELEHIHKHVEPIIPSCIAHSFGTWLICNALDKFKGIKLDKLILCGSILPQDFDWKKIIEDRKQITCVKNDCGGKDVWAEITGNFVDGTGPSGRLGFTQKHERLIDDHFDRFEHSDFFGYDHYESEWIPFLEKDLPYVGETVPPGSEEEPVSPIEAARWSALTYYRQFVTRVVEAIRHDRIFRITKPEKSGEKETPPHEPLKAKGLIVAIPEKPGGAKAGAIQDFSIAMRLIDVNVGNSPRTCKLGPDGYLYDLPSILQSLSYLDHRKDDELIPAVAEFQRMLEKILDGPDSDERAWVKSENVAKLVNEKGRK